MVTYDEVRREKVWRKEILDKRLRNIHVEVGTRKRGRSLNSAGRKEECK
jgi:hypothetical protein